MSESRRPAPSLRGLAVHLGVMASYLAIALLHLRPLAASLSTAIPRGNREDALLHGWILNWTARQLGRDPLALFDSNSFFPYPRSLAYTEHFVPEALPVMPLAAWVENPILLYNLAFLFTFVAAGWGTFLLVRRLTGDPAAAWVAGAFACWFPAKRWTLAHLNTISVHWVPFALLALVGMLRRPGLARALIAGAFVALASLSSLYYSFYFPLLLVPTTLLLVWGDELRLDRRRFGALCLATLTAALLVAPVLAPYADLYPRERGEYEYQAWPASGSDAAEFLILDSWLWSWTVPAAGAKLAAPWLPGLVALWLCWLALRGPRHAAEPRSGPGRRTGRWGAMLAFGVAAIVALRFLLEHHRAWQLDQQAPDRP